MGYPGWCPDWASGRRRLSWCTYPRRRKNRLDSYTEKAGGGRERRGRMKGEGSSGEDQVTRPAGSLYIAQSWRHPGATLERGGGCPPTWVRSPLPTTESALGERGGQLTFSVRRWKKKTQAGCLSLPAPGGRGRFFSPGCKSSPILGNPSWDFQWDFQTYLEIWKGKNFGGCVRAGLVLGVCRRPSPLCVEMGRG